MTRNEKGQVKSTQPLLLVYTDFAWHPVGKVRPKGDAYVLADARGCPVNESRKGWRQLGCMTGP